jgi:hypothetical protein
MSVAVQRQTVSLWPLNASPVNRLPRPPRRAAQDPATAALAAITSSYRHGRAGIIAGDSPAGQLGEQSRADLAVASHLPTVPVAFLTNPEPAEAPAAESTEATTLWSRLVRTRRPAPRGRHSPKA